LSTVTRHARSRVLLREDLRRCDEAAVLGGGGEGDLQALVPGRLSRLLAWADVLDAAEEGRVRGSAGIRLSLASARIRCRLGRSFAAGSDHQPEGLPDPDVVEGRLVDPHRDRLVEARLRDLRDEAAGLASASG